MKVYTLTGKSGTGKSFQAMNLCREYDIESIIDDGIFIYHDRVMAGTSAKREQTKVGAIKAAMFIRPEQREEVKRSIASVKPESVLVIATSDKMADEICEQSSAASRGSTSSRCRPCSSSVTLPDTSSTR